MYSIVGFFAALTYQVADIIFDDFVSAFIAFGILVVAFIVCEIAISKFGRMLAADDNRARKVYEILNNRARFIGYLSYVLSAVSLLCAIVLNR